MILIDAQLAAVVPAKAGTYIPQFPGRLRNMGPGPRFALPGQQKI
jgi:hypothetical protein